MNAVLVLALANAVIVTGLFAIVSTFKSRIRNPAILHLLWILVLVKLVTPPVWTPQLALLPAIQSTSRPSLDVTGSGSSDPALPSNLSRGYSTDAESSVQYIHACREQ